MQNLAGHNESSRLAAEELTRAGIPIVPAATPEHETRSQVDGLLSVGAYTFRFIRCWAYWSARATPDMPMEVVLRLNEAPGPGGGTRYSGSGSNLGAVARAHGFVGGMDSEMVRKWGDCDHWHIDTPEGLVAFVTWLRANLHA